MNFQVSTEKVQNFTGLTRDISARYATHEVINSKPRVESLGVSLETASFTVELNITLGIDVSNAINQWQSICKKSTVSKLIIGGEVIGTNWVVLSIGAAYGIITNNGRIITAKLDISLQEYN